MPLPRLAALTLTLALACAGCGGYDPTDSVDARGCAWVLDVAKYGDAFAGVEVPVCGSIGFAGGDGRLRLADHMKPQWHVVVELPATPNGDPGVGRVLDALKQGGVIAQGRSLEARYHGRVEVVAGGENVLHVSRVDWLDGRPPEWR